MRIMDRLSAIEQRIGIREFLLDDRNHRGEKTVPMWQRVVGVLVGIAVIYFSLRVMCGPNACGAPYWDNHMSP